MRIVHFTGCDVFFPKFIGALSVRTICAVCTICSVCTILTGFTERRLSGIRTIDIPVTVLANGHLRRFPVGTNGFFTRICTVYEPVAVITDGNRGRHAVFSIRARGFLTGVHTIDKPVVVSTDGYGRRHGIFTVRTVLARFSLRGNARILISNKPMAVIADMRCLAALAGSACEEIPEILHRIIAGRPFAAGVVRIIHTAVGNHILPLVKSALSVFSVFPVISFKILEKVCNFRLVFRPVYRSVRYFFFPKLIGRKPGITFRPFGHGDVNIGTGGHQQAYNYPVPLYKFKFTHLYFNCLISL